MASVTVALPVRTRRHRGRRHPACSATSRMRKSWRVGPAPGARCACSQRPTYPMSACVRSVLDEPTACLGKGTFSALAELLGPPLLGRVLGLLLCAPLLQFMDDRTELVLEQQTFAVAPAVLTTFARVGELEPGAGRRTGLPACGHVRLPGAFSAIVTWCERGAHHDACRCTSRTGPPTFRLHGGAGLERPAARAGSVALVTLIGNGAVLCGSRGTPSPGEAGWLPLWRRPRGAGCAVSLAPRPASSLRASVGGANGPQTSERRPAVASRGHSHGPGNCPGPATAREEEERGNQGPRPWSDAPVQVKRAIE